MAAERSSWPLIPWPFHAAHLDTWILLPPGGDVQYNTVVLRGFIPAQPSWASLVALVVENLLANTEGARFNPCLLYTSDAADDRISVVRGGGRVS